MKGISTILAIILIVIIVVALISLTYTFAVGLFTTTTRSATAGTQAVTERLDKRISFVAASCDATTDIVKFTIRHDGATYNIGNDDLSAFIGGSKITTTPDIAVYPGGGTDTILNYGDVSGEFSYTTGTFNPDQSITITVSAPAGTMDQIVTC